MSEMKEMEMKDFTGNPFEMIGKDWMLITAEKNGKVNTMTASWGGVGVLWNYNVVFIFVRKSRYTKEFIDQSDSFSLTFLDPETYREQQSYLGRVSGRDEDKIAKAGLSVERDGDTPYFKEGRTVLLCRKMSCTAIAPEDILDPEVVPKWYSDQDYHDMYVGRIEKVLVK